MVKLCIYVPVSENNSVHNLIMLNSTWQVYLDLISFSSNAVSLRVMSQASADSTRGRIGIGNGIKAEEEEKE